MRSLLGFWDVGNVITRFFHHHVDVYGHIFGRILGCLESQETLLKSPTSTIRLERQLACRLEVWAGRWRRVLDGRGRGSDGIDGGSCCCCRIRSTKGRLDSRHESIRRYKVWLSDRLRHRRSTTVDRKVRKSAGKKRHRAGRTSIATRV